MRSTIAATLLSGTAALLAVITHAATALAQGQIAFDVKAGEFHSLVLRADGSVWAFGRNDHGQLGDGTRLLRTGPVQVQGLSGIQRISTRGDSSYALGADGTVWAWGRNTNGQLGDGTTEDRTAPVRVEALDDVVHISAGRWHALAVRRDGSVWGWGLNAAGQLGDGTLLDRSRPVRTLGLANVLEAHAGVLHSMAITADGSAWTWGSNTSRALGNGTANSSARPVAVANLPMAARTGAVGDTHTLVVLANGSVYGAGLTVYAQLAEAASRAGPPIASPIRIPGLPSIQRVAIGALHSIAIAIDSFVVGWGPNGEGQLGVGPSELIVPAPTPTTGLPPVSAADAGRYHGLAVTPDGAVWAWGNNDFGALGDGSLQSRRERGRVAGPGGVGLFSAVASGPAARAPDARISASAARGTLPLTVAFSATASIDPDGSIRRHSWSVSDGRAATGPEVTFPFERAGTYRIALRVEDDSGAAAHAVHTLVVEHPSNVATRSVSPMVSVSARTFATIALRSDATVRVWGNSQYFGNGTPMQSAVPYPSPVQNLAGVVSVATRLGNLYVVRADGSVWGWGQNHNGQVGDGTTVDRDQPVPLPGLADIREVSVGVGYAMARRGDGTVWAWGSNLHGTLGDGTTLDRNIARQVPGLTDVIAISAGNFHAVALRSDGSVWSWGRGDHHGDRVFGPRLNAAPVPGITAVGIAGGSFATLAARSDGSVWIWGTGPVVGDAARSPVRVGGIDGARAVATNLGSHAALRSDGTLWMWGSNVSGQLGDGTTEDRIDPRQVAGIANVVSFETGATTTVVTSSGQVLAWGNNLSGGVGDGTFATRLGPQLVLGEGGEGFLDLTPSTPNPIPPEKIPVFPIVATGTLSDDGVGSVVADVRFRAQDVGATGNVYVFALAPSSQVMGAAADSPEARKDTPVQCVLAQLTGSGQLQAVSASSLQAYVSGVLAAQGQAVTIINGVPAVSIGGATFYVGYGSSPSGMLSGGTNRSVVSVPGQVQCKPQAPQTGWWWNPDEGGRGYSIEARGNNIFFAAFQYDVSGRSTWHVATGPVSLDGSLFQGSLLSARGGQTLGGAYPGFPSLTNVGAITLAFNDSTTGTLVWPGGAVPIRRFDIIPNGLNLPPVPNQPESGWWWNEAEAGRGYFLEWQGGILNIAGYMYDDAGDPVWYLTQNASPTTNAQQFSSSWWSFANGMTLMGPWKPHQLINNNVAPVTIQFNGAENAIMTLPNGRTTALTRHRF